LQNEIQHWSEQIFNYYYYYYFYHMYNLVYGNK
jgi:hypothetical protein